MTTIQQHLFGKNKYYSPYMDVVGDLFSFTTFTFTNGGVTGRNGPSSFASVSSYTSASWYSTYFSVSSGIQFWYAPTTGSYTIRAAGAAANDGFYVNRGRGIIIESTIDLIKGMRYKILVGQKGSVYYNGSSGGGGGTFMAEFFDIPVIVAGGGGGTVYTESSWDSSSTGSDGQSGTSGSNSSEGYGSGGSNGSGGTGGFANSWAGGGGGFYGDGTNGVNSLGYGFESKGYSFANGGVGGNTATSSVGGFGGGGGTHGYTGGGGGGGGYSGGGGSSQYYNNGSGGGGGSYSQSSISVIGYNRGHGYLTITKN